MENSPICAPEFLLTPAVKSKQIMAVPWAAVGIKDADQPPSPGLQKVMNISEENSEEEMKRINNSTFGYPIAEYSTIDIDKSSLISSDSITDENCSLITLEQPLVPSNLPPDMSIRKYRSISPTGMGDDSRLECMIGHPFSTPFSTPNMNTSSGRKISACGLSPIDVNENE